MIHESTQTPRARRHDANLSRILEAALQMVAADGFGVLSMTKLAKAVDYTPGALYRYFGSKDALLSSMVARILEDLRVHLEQAAAAHSEPLARVFALVHRYRAFAKHEPHRFGLLAMTMAEPRVLLPKDEDAAPVVVIMMATLQPLAGALSDAVAAGELDDGEGSQRTICLFGMLQGILQLHKQARYAPGVLDIDLLAVEGTRALLAGWGAKPAALHAAAQAARTVANTPPGTDALPLSLAAPAVDVDAGKLGEVT